MLQKKSPVDYLPCPECSLKGRTRGGSKVIGTSAYECKTCSSFYQRVRISVCRKLRERYPDETRALRVEAMRDAYKVVLKQYSEDVARLEAQDGRQDSTADES